MSLKDIISFHTKPMYEELHVSAFVMPTCVGPTERLQEHELNELRRTAIKCLIEELEQYIVNELE